MIAPPQTEQIVESIAQAADKLRQNCNAGATPYTDIRELRRSLETLERTLREERQSSLSDAC